VLKLKGGKLDDRGGDFVVGRFPCWVATSTGTLSELVYCALVCYILVY
jgi:hypothetical protein